MKLLGKVLLNGSCGVAIFALLSSTPALAGPDEDHRKHHEGRGEWRKNHPERAQENREMREERHEVRRMERNGKITKEQAHEDMQKINAIHEEERQLAKGNNNHGHLTADQAHKLEGEIHDERATLNQQRGRAPTAGQPADTGGSQPTSTGK